MGISGILGWPGKSGGGRRGKGPLSKSTETETIRYPSQQQHS